MAPSRPSSPPRSITVLAALVLLSAGAVRAMPFQANGIKIGEVDQSSAIIWTRLTSVETGDYQLVSGAAPGSNGEVRAELWPRDNPASITTTPWQAVEVAADHTRQVPLSGLTANTDYELRCQGRALGGGAVTSTVEGSFRTAPNGNQVRPVLCTVVTGQGLDTIDSGTDGHLSYQEMLMLNPDFFIHTGDVLYYDKNVGELSQSLAQIAFRWHDADAIDPGTGRFMITYEETLRPSGFGLVTLTSDRTAGDLTLRFMSRLGYQYRVESSADFNQWNVAAAGLQARGSLIEFRDEDALTAHPRRFYRVIESEIAEPTSLPPFASATNGTLLGNSGTAGEDFNRADFVLDLVFTTPADLGAGSDFLLFETGGSSRGTVVALQGGKLGITAGHDGESIVNFLGTTALLPSTRYSLRVDTVSEAAPAADRFSAQLWEAGQPGSSSIINQAGLTVDGFSGSNGAGIGRVNDQSFTAGLALPVTQAPAAMEISMQAYHPGDATPELPLPDQPQP